jgi:hypothetical protein
MVDRIRIGYFLEDRGHEILLKAFVAQVAKEKGFMGREWYDDVRAATGGKSIQSYRDFLRDFARRERAIPFDVLIVASDGNCMGYQEKKTQLLQYAEKAKFPRLDMLVFALPDPHIEKWYMADPAGFNRAIGSGALPVLPRYKCEKGLYKKVMREAVLSSDVAPQFGGYEYGERIVEEMDLYEASKADKALKSFIDDLGDALTRIKAQRHHATIDVG